MRWMGFGLVLASSALVACAFDSTGSSAGGDAGLGGSTGEESTSTTGTTGASNTTPTSGTTTQDPTDPTVNPSDPTVDPTEDPSDPTEDPSDPTEDPTDPTEDPTDPTEDPTDPTDDSTDGSSSTTAEPGEALLELDGDAFGDVDLGSAPSRTFTVSNVGDGMATELAASVPNPFQLDASDCGDLAPDDTCDLVVTLDANELGPFDGDLVLDYATDADTLSVTASVSANTTGSTGNLVSNPGFENCPNEGTVPANWTDSGPGQWACWNDFDGVQTVDGNRLLAADSGPSNQSFTIEQAIDVSALQNAIATGSMSFAVRVQARSWQTGNDEYRLRARYFDSGDNLLNNSGSGFASSDNWVQLSRVNDAPPNTATLVVELGCEKNGGDYCDAYYDQVSVVATYE